MQRYDEYLHCIPKNYKIIRQQSNTPNFCGYDCLCIYVLIRYFNDIDYRLGTSHEK